MSDEMALKATVEAHTEIVRRAKNAIHRVIIGQEHTVEQLLIALLAGGHALFEGVPGLGKTLLVRTVANCFDLSFSRIQFTPDLMPADIVGTNIITTDEEGKSGFQFQVGPIFASLVLADEINRATPKTQSALLEAMQERTVTVAGVTRPLPEPFFVLATQNPLEQEGTYPLPEAQIDRFLLKIFVDFPSEEELVQIAKRTAGRALPVPEPVADGELLIEMQAFVQSLLVSDDVVQYAVQLLMFTHPEKEGAPEVVKQFVKYGASPRGVQALIKAAKARAFLHGRLHVAYEDIEAVYYPCMRHRLLLNFEGEATGVQPEQVLEAVLEAARKHREPSS